MSKRIIIIGAGGHGKVVAALAVKCGYGILGFLDDNYVDNGFMGYPMLGNVSDARKWKGDSEFIIAIGNNSLRQLISEEYNDLCWSTLVHPTAQVSLDVELGVGTVIFTNAVVNPGTKIGRHCIINTSSVVEHDNILEDYVHISPGAILCGTVFIGSRTHIGAGAVIRNNVYINSDCTIGAGAVAVKNIIDPGVYIGIPVKRLT